MRWEREAKELLDAVLARVPAFVRGMVRRVVDSECTAIVDRRGGGEVTAADVRVAFEATTPGPMRPLLARVLAERDAAASAHLPLPDEVAFAVGEPMSADEIRAFLEWEGTGRLGVVDAEGRPYVVPLSFVLDGGVAYYHWFAEDGRKARAVARRREVCFEVDWATRDQLSYRSVIGDGVLEEVVEVAERRRILERLAAKFPAYATGAGHSEPIRAVIERGHDAMAQAVRIYGVRFTRLVGKKKGHAPY